ncbi:M24 family metallopeptidase [Bombilactobacillus thymidiniphilus]|uniref:Xaa-Pro peptidase family protein n=1 Tax=Bombilactobacillus thymidiniphilus TaxID=2923363 RepID=A0ABY4PDM7_9LACO|nr:Xaa-Pro peptidase family protein [Bombilactobacillus thymidiniphilus]UQS83883.1 Xaa-Pro peptidase family protein [Bombilactobacillus thymidiniphilus]
MNHLQSLQKWLADSNYDVAYISNPTDILYFTGFHSDPEERVLALFAFPEAEPFLFTPQLEVEASKKAGWQQDVYGYLDHEDPFQIIAEHINERTKKTNHWAIEKADLPYARYEAVQQKFPNAQFTGDASEFLDHLKLIKSPAEIKLMKEAGQQADYAFKLGFEALSTKLTEQQVVAEIEYGLMKQGVMHTSFDTIVQSGENAANPHGVPEKKSIKANSLALFDLGTVNQGYMSDASRTVAFGEPTAKQKEIYNVCLQAQLSAMDAAKPGITAEELDAVARKVITDAGYGEYFIHRLGHGIGTSTHEFPSIMQGNSMELQPGMCFSIEPGIYIPGVAGVRIEDCLYLTENGNEPFTHTTKELQIIPVK